MPTWASPRGPSRRISPSCRGARCSSRSSQRKAWGYDAQHLRLRIQEDCGFDALYRVAETPRGTRGINYGYGSTGVVIDFWVLDLDGAAVVVDAWHQVDSSVGLVDKVTRAAESISFVRP